MTTDVKDSKKPNDQKPTTTRVIGTIMKDPEARTSGASNTYLAFPIVVSPGAGQKDTWWNCKIMFDFAEKLPAGLLEKYRYLKVSGLGSSREWTKDGRSGVSNDLLITGVEMQNGEYIKPDKKGEAEPGSEG